MWRSSRQCRCRSQAQATLGPRALANGGRKKTAQTLPFSTSSRLCPCLCLAISALPLEKNYYGMRYPASHPADLCFASRGTTFFHTVHVCKPPYASMECTVCCMQYAACSCPASTTSSATGSNSRVLMHRLTVCSRSELLHRGKYLLRLTRDDNFECQHASSRS